MKRAERLSNHLCRAFYQSFWLRRDGSSLPREVLWDERALDPKAALLSSLLSQRMCEVNTSLPIPIVTWIWHRVVSQKGARWVREGSSWASRVFPEQGAQDRVLMALRRLRWLLQTGNSHTFHFQWGRPNTCSGLPAPARGHFSDERLSKTWSLLVAVSRIEPNINEHYF